VPARRGGAAFSSKSEASGDRQKIKASINDGNDKSRNGKRI
jgi:hypothetical protein